MSRYVFSINNLIHIDWVTYRLSVRVGRRRYDGEIRAGGEEGPLVSAERPAALTGLWISIHGRAKCNCCGPVRGVCSKCLVCCTRHRVAATRVSACGLLSSVRGETDEGRGLRPESDHGQRDGCVPSIASSPWRASGRVVPRLAAARWPRLVDSAPLQKGVQSTETTPSRRSLSI